MTGSMTDDRFHEPAPEPDTRGRHPSPENVFPSHSSGLRFPLELGNKVGTAPRAVLEHFSLKRGRDGDHVPTSMHG